MAKQRFSKTKVVLICAVLLFAGWFFTREIQTELPYKLSSTDILEVKEQCRKLAESKVAQWSEVFDVELVSSGFSENGGFCYIEYFHYSDDWTVKELYNATGEDVIYTKQWPDEASIYNRGFDWYINGKRRFYQNTF